MARTLMSHGYQSMAASLEYVFCHHQLSQHKLTQIRKFDSLIHWDYASSFRYISLLHSTRNLELQL